MWIKTCEMRHVHKDSYSRLAGRCHKGIEGKKHCCEQKIIESALL